MVANSKGSLLEVEVVAVVGELDARRVEEDEEVEVVGHYDRFAPAFCRKILGEVVVEEEEVLGSD